ncbi:MAG: response regulator [Kouleothrix sp.]|nr:response regulator [Kouleothrix sp.]
MTTIMIVDDEPAIGKLLLYQLAGFGYQVSYVQDGIEALQRLPATRPDLVLLDVMMPLISGWEVCRQIRAWSAVPIIMLTAKGADSDIVAGLSAGADDYLTKPFSMAQLHARIEAVLRRAQPAGRAPALARPVSRVDPHLDVEAPAAAPVDVAAAPETDQGAPPPAPARAPKPAKAPPIGQLIRDARQLKGLTLHEVEQESKIRWEFLQAVEQENWAYLPPKQRQSIVAAYAAYLGIEPAALAGRRRSQRVRSGSPYLVAALVLLIALAVAAIYLIGAGLVALPW